MWVVIFNANVNAFLNITVRRNVLECANEMIMKVYQAAKGAKIPENTLFKSGSVCAKRSGNTK